MHACHAAVPRKVPDPSRMRHRLERSYLCEFDRPMQWEEELPREQLPRYLWARLFLAIVRPQTGVAQVQHLGKPCQWCPVHHHWVALGMGRDGNKVGAPPTLVP